MLNNLCVQLNQTVNVTLNAQYIPLWPLRVIHPTGPDKETTPSWDLLAPTRGWI
jgi:hypothetical protein